MKKTASVLFLIIFILTFTLNIGADTNIRYGEPYQSYIYNSWADIVAAPAAYNPEAVIRGQDLGIGGFKNPGDVVYDKESNTLFIIDTGNNRIVLLNNDLSLKGVIDKLKGDSEVLTLNQPSSMFIFKGHLYVADTYNNRILVLEEDGSIISEFGKPDTDLISSVIAWLPRKLTVDRAGRIYVIATGVNQGLVELNPDGAFRTFTGANKAQYTLWEYMLKQISTDEQKARMALFVPTEYSSMCIDNEDFIYVTSNVSIGTSNTDTLVRKLNPKGNEVLRRLGYFDIIGDVYFDGTSKSIGDVTSTKNGVYSILETTYGRVFTYDNDGNMLFIFGGNGQQFGNTKSACAIEYVGENMLVLDNMQNNVTLFKPTVYGKAILEATDCYYNGKYQESMDLWQDIIDKNANYDLAYLRLGKIYLYDNDYETAMRMFKLANVRDMYSKAFELYRKDLIEQYFPLFLSIALILVVGFGIFKFVRKIRKEGIKYESN